MSDLVQELRDLAERNAWPLGERAAQEIEKLREELAQWRSLMVNTIERDAKR